MSKKFNVDTAVVGDVIPSGTIVYKKVNVVVATNGIHTNLYSAILVGVVTKPGIVTYHGPKGKCRVRGLMPVMIYRRTTDGCVFHDEAVSTADGVAHNDQHPDGITYKVGKRVSVREFEDRPIQCAPGIHVYLTVEGAENHY